MENNRRVNELLDSLFDDGRKRYNPTRYRIKWGDKYLIYRGNIDFKTLYDAKYALQWKHWSVMEEILSIMTGKASISAYSDFNSLIPYFDSINGLDLIRVDIETGEESILNFSMLLNE